MVVKPCLIKGCRWQIVDRSSVSIWLDYWIPGAPTLHLFLSGENNTSELIMVADLIDKQKNWQDVEKINSAIDPDVARKILKVPLLLATQPDQQIWNLEKNGCFTVKSAYCLIMDDLAIHQGGSSTVIRT